MMYLINFLDFHINFIYKSYNKLLTSIDKMKQLRILYDKLFRSALCVFLKTNLGQVQ